MKHNDVTQRAHALRSLDAARDLVDLIASMHAERDGLGMSDVDIYRGRQLSKLIGEANGQLGFALKSAGVHAQLDAADATREATAYAKYVDGRFDDVRPITLSGERP